jgi:hypothetical protein
MHLSIHSALYDCNHASIPEWRPMVLRSWVNLYRTAQCSAAGSSNHLAASVCRMSAISNACCVLRTSICNRTLGSVCRPKSESRLHTQYLLADSVLSMTRQSAFVAPCSVMRLRPQKFPVPTPTKAIWCSEFSATSRGAKSVHASSPIDFDYTGLHLDIEVANTRVLCAKGSRFQPLLRTRQSYPTLDSGACCMG